MMSRDAQERSHLSSSLTSRGTKLTMPKLSVSFATVWFRALKRGPVLRVSLARSKSLSGKMRSSSDSYISLHHQRCFHQICEAAHDCNRSQRQEAAASAICHSQMHRHLQEQS